MANAKKETATNEAAQTAAPAATTGQVPAFTVKRRVTLPVLKLPVDKPVYFTVTGPMFTGKKVDDQKEPATLINVVDLMDNGAQKQVIVPAVLKGIFTDEYKDNAYVGLSFEVIKHPKASGKSYNPFTVVEIELEG